MFIESRIFDVNNFTYTAIPWLLYNLFFFIIIIN